ncbi:hypothetical protein Ancab_027464 [Ancistrocladus abbreviatus]
MEGNIKLMLLALLLAAVIGEVPMMARGQSICGLTKRDLDACMPAVRMANPLPPSSDCCKVVAGADLQCLCSYRKSTILPALGINPTEAIKLPAKCNINPTFRCKDS